MSRDEPLFTISDSADSLSLCHIFRPRACPLHTIAALAGALILGACQALPRDGGPSVSLDQAKKITANLEAPDYEPPARTINDILETIGPEKVVPANCEPSQMFREPVLKGWDLSQDVSRQWAAEEMLEMASREFLKGDYANSLRLAGDAVSLMPSAYDTQFRWGSDYGRWFQSKERQMEKAATSFTLTRYYALAGDLDAAGTSLANGNRALGSVPTRGYDIDELSREYYMAHALVAEAYLAHTAGRYAEAELLYQTLLTKYAILPPNISQEILRADLAEVLAYRGRLAEAEVEARKALLKRYGPTLETTYVLLRLVRILNAQGRYLESETLTRRIINIYQVECAPRGSITLALARQQLASSLVGQARWAAALAQFETIENAVRPADPDIFARLFERDLDWAIALQSTGRNRDAVNKLQMAVVRMSERFGEDDYKTAEARGLMGMALARAGARAEALRQLKRAIPVLVNRYREAESGSRDLPSQERRFVQILESYIELLTSIRATPLEESAGGDAVGQAFSMAELARGRSVQRALSASSARATADPQLAELARSEQDAQLQISALSKLMVYQASLPRGEQDQNVVARLQDRITELRAARTALWREIRSSYPEYAELIEPKPVAVDGVQGILHQGEVLISIYTTRKRVYVWVVPKSGRIAFTALDLGNDELEGMVARIRVALDPSASTLGEIPDFDLETAYALYASLMKPLAPAWQDAAHLLVVTNGPLGQLPFQVLPTARVQLTPERPPLFSRYRAVPWLARSHTVTVLPSVASLATLRSRTPGLSARKPFAGFGDPYFSKAQEAEAAGVRTAAFTKRGALTVRGLPVRLRSAPNTRGVDSAELARLPRLPDTADEIRAIAATLGADPSTDVFLGKRASEGAVKTMDLSDRRVLAFATHGLVPGDLNGLTQPALALSSPTIVGGDEDGLLTMGEILGLRLDADWVVLSACNTAAGDGAGAEAVSGLGRAFFYAGARSLLVSNWPVETSSAKALTTSIFKRQSNDPTLSRTDALQQAMLGLIDEGGYVDGRGRMAFSYAHPIFWAPFSLVGDGGPSQNGNR